MRVISWNCNRAFRKKINEIVKFQPDILVVQECENELRLKESLEKTEYNQIIWYGDSPHKGLAVISFNQYSIQLNPNHNTAFRYVVPITVSNGKDVLCLYHIWAMPHKTDRAKSYIGQIWGAVQFYQKALEKPSILIGDFNSNVFWDKPNREAKHQTVVDLLKQYDIESVYHHFYKEKQGEESQPTLYLLKKEDRPYHIDYCFVSKDLISKETKITVGQYQDWIKLSDHMPLFIDELIF